jgi:hypothetical protein
MEGQSYKQFATVAYHMLQGSKLGKITTRMLKLLARKYFYLSKKSVMCLSST